MSNNVDEALKNIDVFCKVLVDKISGESKTYKRPEPIENLLKKKVTVEVCKEHALLEEPLVDFFEDEKQIKILVLTQHLPSNKLTLGSDSGHLEVRIGECLKIKIPSSSHFGIGKVDIERSSYTLEITLEKAQK